MNLNLDEKKILILNKQIFMIAERLNLTGHNVLMGEK